MTEHVYFAKFGDAIKVGVSKDAGHRLEEFATGNQFEGEILGVAEGDHRLEKAMHKLLRPHHVRGEWFRDCEEVRKVIAEVALPLARTPKADPRAPRPRATITDLMKKAKGWFEDRPTTRLAAIVGCDVTSAERYFSGSRAPTAENFLALLRSPIGPRLLEEATRNLSPEEYHKFWRAMGDAALRAFTRGNNEANR